MGSRYSIWRRLVFAALCALACGLVSAEQVSDGIRSELIAEVRTRQVGPDGRESFRYEPARILSQGETVYYTVKIHNPTNTSIRQVSVLQRIPVNTTYLPGSAAGPGALVMLSRDGGNTFEPEVRRSARSRDAQDAPAYTHIRWELQHALAPGATALARFQAVFN